MSPPRGRATRPSRALGARWLVRRLTEMGEYGFVFMYTWPSRASVHSVRRTRAWCRRAGSCKPHASRFSVVQSCQSYLPCFVNPCLPNATGLKHKHAAAWQVVAAKLQLTSSPGSTEC